MTPMSESPWIVSAEWLSQHLADVNVVVVDCRFALTQPDLGQQQYQASHIPGAFYLDLNRDLSSPVGPHGGRHPLPDADRLAQKLAAIGIQSGSHPIDPEATLVVVYDDSKFAFAARLWWLLRYYGHDRVAILDGGWSGWQAAGYPVTSDLPQPRQGHFMPNLRSDWVVDRDQLQSQLNSADLVLIDSREAERYRGEQEPIDPIAGHIPGAVNYPWQGITDAKGYLHPLSMQQQRWADLPAGDMVVYCGSGVTACVNLLSLAIVGQAAKLYAGSWSDWCSYL